MPFITSKRRTLIDSKGLDGLEEIQPGDRCYVFYREMVKKWMANPRWTTAHRIYAEVLVCPRGGAALKDNEVARELAWQIFFQLWVMPYERRKLEENGDIQ